MPTLPVYSSLPDTQITQIDDIGVIVLYDEEGNETYRSPGWRVNIPEEYMTEELEQYRVTPTRPYRVYAGDLAPTFDKTAFLSFDSEEDAKNAIYPNKEIEL